MGKKYVIWDGLHGAYWRPDSRGYTTNVLLAGAYTKAEAEAIKRRIGDRHMDIMDAGERAQAVFKGQAKGSVAEYLGWFDEIDIW